MNFITEVVLESIIHFVLVFIIIWSIYYFSVLGSLKDVITEQLFSICKSTISPIINAINYVFYFPVVDSINNVIGPLNQSQEVALDNDIKNSIKNAANQILTISDVNDDISLISSYNALIVSNVITIVVFLLIIHFVIYAVYVITANKKWDFMSIVYNYSSRYILFNIVLFIIIGLCEINFIYSYGIKYIPLTASEFANIFKNSILNII